MLSRLSAALFDPRNAIVLIPVIWIIIGIQVAHVAGLVEMRFDFASYAVSLSYLVAVAIHFAHPAE